MRYSEAIARILCIASESLSVSNRITVCPVLQIEEAIETGFESRTTTGTRKKFFFYNFFFIQLHESSGVVYEYLIHKTNK